MNQGLLLQRCAFYVINGHNTHDQGLVIEGTNMHDQIVFYVCQSFSVEVQTKLATYNVASFSSCPQSW